jgi:hypothetical protein
VIPHTRERRVREPARELETLTIEALPGKPYVTSARLHRRIKVFVVERE